MRLLIGFILVFSAPAGAGPFADRLVTAAHERLKHDVTYDPAYVVLKYPGGDVPAHTGVCTDVIIRAYRALGIDLQKRVHEDMRAHFQLYPTIWGASRPDRNIDHRRVPNLAVFFRRHGQRIKVSKVGSNYRAGDLVTWNLKIPGRGTLPHIGIVVKQKSKDGKRPLIVHNIGAGPVLEDMLFDYTITGHYRYQPE
tara:strand:- start:4271 stop:4858 length:588 start_codon:yes stop_codon:yes gene_type:complete